MHVGFSLGVAQPDVPKASVSVTIVAYGDSLTAGAGASSLAQAYPAVAANLFTPARTVANRGIGGQSSTEIAARQGGLPLLIAVRDSNPKNLYPHSRDWMDTFEGGSINGLTHLLVQKGRDETGLPYGDVRIQGTATASFTDIGRLVYGAIAANYEIEPGGSWTISADAQLVGGSAAGVVGLRLLLIEADELGGYLDEIAAPSFQLDGTRSHVAATGLATHRFIRSTILLSVTEGSTIDLTLRIFSGQFEAGGSETALQLTPGDGQIPAYHPTYSTTHRFSASAEGWTPRQQDGHTTPIRVEGGKLVIENDDAGTLRGCELAVAAIPEGKLIRIAFDIDFPVGTGLIHVGGLNTPGGSWATRTADGNPTWVISSSGHHELVFTSGNMDFGNPVCGALAILTSGTSVVWSLDNIVVEWGDDSPQVPVTYRSIDVFHGTSSASAGGTVAGTRGTLTVESGSTCNFTRSVAGDCIPVPYETPFKSDEAMSHRRYLQWIWAGRNNAMDQAAVLSDIASMVAHTTSGRFLIGSILTSAGDTPPTKQAIFDLNSELLRRYGPHYVDLHTALLAAGNGSALDEEDRAARIVPRSLRSDPIHLNDQGYAIVAEAWVAATLAMGW
ncbi:SGNH/GDSL hydrolase family protein [Rhizobium sp. S96]|uniref:SGNH/GDSL hydrolase family protein n=1 Tax=Rhizobium sp. S96 TaxID=3055140 RepID=UPI0025AA8D41|nr:SGNH/GDSL hydrolase family protein [Rhizobium sp. S96]MDM9622456.1 SGNH/GDSL hydrolase family protein [Rhizobium sp. S96]